MHRPSQSLADDSFSTTYSTEYTPDLTLSQMRCA